jgi:5'-nucleotidase
VGAQTPATVHVQVLAFNDFHGSLEPRTGSSGRIGTTDAGGVEYLAASLAQLKATSANTVIVSAGDNVGASPLLSSMFHDEPTIEALGIAGLQISAVGNHEFDEGWTELLRIQKGWCHPIDGCQDNTPFAGAQFQYLAANVWLDPRLADRAALRRFGRTSGARQRLLPASAVRTFDGVKVGFIGLTLRTAPQLVTAAGIKGITFQGEAQAANAAARALRQRGVRTIVVLIHEGGTPEGSDVNGCENFSGPIVDIVNAMSPDIDVVVSGHTHQAYVCTIAGKLVTSAANYGRLITDIDLQVNRRTGRVTSKQARNVIVTHDVPKAPAETALLAHYRPFAATLGNRIVGVLQAPIPRSPNPAGECPIGDVIADGMLQASRDPDKGGAVAAFMNPGGIRADLMGTADEAGSRGVTYEQAFDVLPFGNQIVVKTMIGEAVVQLLEQQFENRTSECGRLLQVAGLSYEYDPAKPVGSRIDRASIRIGGQPLVATNRYRLASNDFLWAGGDNFTVARESFDPVGVGLDVDLFVDYLGRHMPLPVPLPDRIRRHP